MPHSSQPPTQPPTRMTSPQYLGFDQTISAPHMHAHALELLRDKSVRALRVYRRARCVLILWPSGLQRRLPVCMHALHACIFAERRPTLRACMRTLSSRENKYPPYFAPAASHRLPSHTHTLSLSCGMLQFNSIQARAGRERFGRGLRLWLPDGLLGCVAMCEKRERGREGEGRECRSVYALKTWKTPCHPAAPLPLQFGPAHPLLPPSDGPPLRTTRACTPTPHPISYIRTHPPIPPCPYCARADA